jgi:(3,5-dihydroxyphenyl)acetyl-CoA 1,2-dioxygenase
MNAITDHATDALQQAGLSSSEVADWAQAAPLTQPGSPDSFRAAADALSGFLSRGLALADRLPSHRTAMTEAEHAAAAAISSALTDARKTFLRAHVEELYAALTNGGARAVRVEELVYAAAAMVPGLTPSQTEMEPERERSLADKQGLELAQGLLVEHVLAEPGAGRHLIDSMLAPTPQALELLPEFTRTGVADLGPVRLTRRGPASTLELSNPRHLNAEDGSTLGPTEWAVDLVLLDPETEIGVFRGGVVDHPRYAGERIFGAGINLTHLYRGRIDYMFFLIRDLGYVSKLYRGVGSAAESVEKLWIAAVERYAIGGGCQLLHVVDHVIANRGSRLYLPARKEGIIPGASNLRLPRSVGDRAARQAILSGREWTAGDADAELLIDEVVEPGEMDAAIESRVDALTSSGLVNAAANRRAMRVGQEPLDMFREYMSEFSREQAYCHLSPALVRNLERHWNAANRGD